MAHARREQWTRRLLGLQVRANDLVKLGDFREAQRALRISRRAYDHWGRECFRRPHQPQTLENTRDLANAFRL